MSIKLGDHTVLLDQDVPTGAEDEYGQRVSGKAYEPLRWCLITPTYSTGPTNRNAPEITGMTLLAPPGNRNKIQAAARIWYPYTMIEPADGDAFPAGRMWEVVGEIGDWDEAVECQLRRLL